jgi:hypothetical protein
MSTTKLRDRVAVECPIADVQPRLQAYFARRRDADGITRLSLRVPLDPVGAGLALEREVSVVAQRGRDDQNLNDLIRIRWEPVEPGPFPAFNGTLVTWAEHDPSLSYVELDGTYDVPLGVAGEVFDEVIGHALAQRTAHALLLELARAIGTPVTVTGEA